ncbi:cytochrome b/b6 domain-containing protein [Thioclava sp. FR2]|uniref:cytochrome b/b6 domain-containing protein n=1 Tax=Thioclava sp. FR2 TaxID=3445780 RepID=UPI003EB70E27
MAAPNLSAGQGGAVSPPNPWDPLIRVIHWAVVLAILVNGLIVKPGGSVHVWIGWTVMTLLALRLVWGLVGPSEARFSSFPPNPKAALAHLRDLLRGKPREHASHNPAGALMVYALWASLAVVIATGLVMTDGKTPMRIAEDRAAVAAGDWSVLVVNGDESDDDKSEGRGEDLAEELHEGAVNLIWLLALLHVAGVAVESRALGRNLVRPMLFGSRKGNVNGTR